MDLPASPPKGHGRDHAWNTIFQEATIRLVHGWLRKLRVPERDRPDLAQSVFLAAVESFPSYDPSRGSPGRWLNGITMHVAGHHADKASHRREVLTEPGDLQATDDRPSATELLLEEERRSLLSNTVLELPIDLRSLLIQHDLDGVPMSEVAALWSLPVSTAYRRRSLAIARAQAALVEHLAAERNGRSREGGDQARRPGIRPAPG
ncbi:sigma-70 family RNA polymerase sigma factor [Sorangium sp. So ce291]|uniref:RNA polymerase sigma factor n=1 Tax=Sorangium sp. So ce291 TaxID=3133294 RepID=UPI003F5FC251